MAPVNSVRHLFLRQARQHLGLESQHKHFLQDDGDDDPVVDPGDMHLNSFYAPALTADKPYTIISNQQITVPDSPAGTQPEQLHNQIPQTFSVFAPQFKLEHGDIHSYYPPHAHSDQPYVLPHIVFADPHLPWERGAKYNSNLIGRNRIPWLALLVFDGNAELKLSASQLAKGGLFPDDMIVNGNPVPQDNLNFTVSMSWDQLNRCSPTVARQISNNDLDKPDISTPLNAIFLPPSLYTALFAGYDPPANSGYPPIIQAKPNLDRYKYLAHYRNINTVGMAGAGVQDEGLYSIVIFHRTGPLNLVSPRNMVVHLVSLDGLPENVQFPLKDGTAVGALVSLFSWNYRCLPASTLSFVDNMRAICRQSQEMLRPPKAILDQATAWSAPSLLTSKIMIDRLSLGYSMVRYRVQTGEETVAFVRGALSPVPISRNNFNAPIVSPTGGPTSGGQWPAQSNSGVDYQILDPQLGIMDLTYSTAWQLGRTLALADRAFSSALTRYRCAAYTTALSNAKIKLMAKHGKWRSQKKTLTCLKDTIDVLAKLHLKKLDDEKMGDHMKKRWDHHEIEELLDLSMGSPEVQAAFKEELHDVMVKLSSGKSTGYKHSDEFSDPPPYNEFNSPYFSDWPVILAWLLDRMHLASVPAHHLITDPSHLPTESLRFFYIDPVWVDCLLDGALSIANHLTRDDDIIRQKIKDRLNDYLTTPLDPSKPVKLYPQVPITGFLLRSAVVEAMPDLQVSVPYVSASHPKSELCRQEILDKGIMLVLLDRTFDDNNLSNITFSQPPHQQFYWIGDLLDTESVEITPKKMLNNSTPTQLVDPKDPRWGEALCDPITWRKDGKGNPPSGQIYDWETYLVQVETLATTFKDLLNTYMAGQVGWKEDDEPSAAVMAFQLNATNYFATLVNPTPTPQPSDTQVATSYRQIYLGELEEKQTLKRAATHEKPSRLGSSSSSTSRPVFYRSSTQVIKAADPPPHVSVSRPLPPHAPPVPNFKPQSALLSYSSSLDAVFSFPPRSAFPMVGPQVDQCSQGTLTPTACYSYTVFPSYLLQTLPPGVLPQNAVIPIDANKKIDVAIGINLVDTTPPPNLGDLLFLRDVEVAVPVRERNSQSAALADDGIAALTYADYGSDGTKPSLLSNARWVVKTSVVDAATYAATKHSDHPIHRMHPGKSAATHRDSHLHHRAHHRLHSHQGQKDPKQPGNPTISPTVATTVTIDAPPESAPIVNSPPTAYLVSRLIPRSMYNMVYFTQNPSCSILLPLVEVDPYIPPSAPSSSAGANFTSPSAHSTTSVGANATSQQAAMTFFCTECYWLYPGDGGSQIGLTYGQSVTVLKGLTWATLS